jgi:hypothetical protein
MDDVGTLKCRNTFVSLSVKRKVWLAAKAFWIFSVTDVQTGDHGGFRTLITATNVGAYKGTVIVNEKSWSKNGGDLKVASDRTSRKKVRARPRHRPQNETRAQEVLPQQGRRDWHQDEKSVSRLRVNVNMFLASAKERGIECRSRRAQVN